MDSFYDAIECLRKNNFAIDCGYLTAATGKPILAIFDIHEESKMTEETKETKTETIDTNKVEEILIYLIKALLNKEIEAQQGQVILQGLSMLHLIRAEKEKNAQQKTN